MSIDDARYPIGRLTPDTDVTQEKRAAWIEQIRATPAALREAVAGLSAEQLDTPYREGGWTVRQVVHHLPDSHLNAYVRFKLGLTEDEPVVKPYDEARWAELPDTRRVAPDVSLALLDALHARWVALLEGMSPDDFARAVMHPENGRTTLDRMLQLYAWHGRHHVGHVTALRGRRGW